MSPPELSEFDNTHPLEKSSLEFASFQIVESQQNTSEKKAITPTDLREQMGIKPEFDFRKDQLAQLDRMHRIEKQLEQMPIETVKQTPDPINDPKNNKLLKARRLSPKQWWNRMKLQQVMRRKGIKQPGETLQALELIHLRSIQATEMDEYTKNELIDLDNSLIEEPEYLTYLSRIKDPINCFHRLHSLGCEAYTLELPYQIDHPQLAQVANVVDQMPDQLFDQNLKQLKHYPHILDNFVSTIDYLDETDLNEGFLDYLTSKKPFDQDTIAALTTARVLHTIDQQSHFTFVNSAYHTGNIDECKNKQPRWQQMKRILISSMADSPNGTISANYQDLPSLLELFQNEDINEIYVLADRGWKVSHCPVEYNPYKPSEIQLSLVKNIETQLYDSVNVEWLNLAGDLIQASGLAIDLTDIRHCHTIQLFLSDSGKQLMQGLTSVCSTLHEQGGNSQDFLKDIFTIQGEPPCVIPNLRVIAEHMGRLTQPPSYKKFEAFINTLPPAYTEDATLSLTLATNIPKIAETLENNEPPSLDIYRNYVATLHDIPNHLIESHLFAKRGHDNVLFFITHFVPPELQPLQHIYQSINNPSIARFIAGSLSEDPDKLQSLITNGKVNVSFFMPFAERGSMYAVSNILDNQELTYLDPNEKSYIQNLNRLPQKSRTYVAGERNKFLQSSETGTVRVSLLAKLVEMYSNLPITARENVDHTVLSNLINEVTQNEDLDAATRKIDTANQIVTRAFNIRSHELHQMLGSLLPMVMESSNPLENFNRIASLYEESKLPSVFKEYVAFKAIYSQTNAQGISLIQERLNKADEHLRLSPLLTQSTDPERFRIFLNYQVKLAIDSGDPNLRSYLQSFIDVREILSHIDTFGIEVLPESQLEKVSQFLDHIDALAITGISEQISSNFFITGSLQDRLTHLSTLLQSGDFRTLPKLIEGRLFKPFGFESSYEVVNTMDQAKKKANERNHRLAQQLDQGQPLFAPGDLLKSTQSRNINSIIQGALKCAEAMGGDSNNTPFDADCSRIGEQDAADGYEAVLANSITETSMTGDNDVLILMKDHGQYVDTTEGVPDGFPGNFTQFEIFHSIYGDYQYGKPNDPNRRHYGVLVGEPGTDISAVILKDKFVNDPKYEARLAKLCFEIASSRVDCPVIYKNQKIFDPEQADRYRINPETLNTLLQTDNVSAGDIHQCLRQSAALATLYDLPNDGPGTSIDQHTRTCQHIFDEYLKDKYMFLHLNPNEFKLMLNLHDIGKPASSNSLEQHQFTRPIIENIVEDLNLSQVKKDLIVEIACQDALGEYLKGSMSSEDVVKEMDHLAKVTHVTVDEIFNLCYTYYLADAASYTQAINSNNKSTQINQVITVDSANHLITLTPEYKQKINIVTQQINSRRSPPTLPELRSVN